VLVFTLIQEVWLADKGFLKGIVELTSNNCINRLIL